MSRRFRRRSMFIILVLSVQALYLILVRINSHIGGVSIRQNLGDFKSIQQLLDTTLDVQIDSRHEQPVARFHSDGTDQEKKGPAKQPNSHVYNVSREEIFRKRKDLVLDGCKEYTAGKECRMNAYGRTLVDEAHKTLFCEIFKVGSSNWLRTFLGFVVDVTPNFRERIGNYYKRLNMCNKPGERDAILKDYTTRFMFVRHPFSRLVSCFADKIVHDPDMDFIERHLKMIEGETGTRPANLTFSNFVDYIIQVSVNDEGIDKLDPHIKPMYRTCCPCEVKYDFIGHLETQKEDSDFILKQMGVNVTFPQSDPIATDSSGKGTIAHYFNQLNPEQISGLYKIYMWDFQLFGYDFPDYLTLQDIKT
ncbi:carbohydrate sulfotransferase 11-like isoform X2 [Ptychodera flava]